MREFIKNINENIKKILKPEKITAEQLAQTIPYEDQLLKIEDKANLFIRPDGTPMLVDRDTGEVPFVWKNYDEFNPEIVKTLKEKIGIIKPAKILEKEVVKKEVSEEEIKKTAPAVNVEKQEIFLN